MLPFRSRGERVLVGVSEEPMNLKSDSSFERSEEREASSVGSSEITSQAPMIPCVCVRKLMVVKKAEH